MATIDEPDDVWTREPDEQARRAEREAEELEDGSLDADELSGEPDWWDEGSDDET